MKRHFKAWIIAVLLAPCAAGAAEFQGLTEAAASGDYGSLKAVLIQQGDQSLYEEYFRGTQPDDRHQMHSVTKSVGSTLVGILHRQGRISLENTLSDLFLGHYPMNILPYVDKRSVTVESVLQQRHGVDINEWATDYRDGNNPVGQAISSGDWYGYFLSRPIEAPQGILFRYSTLGSNLMSRMIRWSTGLGPGEFAANELFGPLGIEGWFWELSTSPVPGNGLTVWANPDGDEPLGHGLWLKPRDMMKIGRVYLDDGVYEGRRILDKRWIEAAWTTYSNSQNTPLFAPFPGNGYGYQWWKQRITDDRGRNFSNFYASGWARQHILVFPEMNLVVVSVADDYDYTGPGIGALLRSFILPELNPLLDSRFDGAWYNPETDGQGLTLQVLGDGDSIVGFWYTYDADGNKRWFVMTGEITGSEAVVSIVRTEGGAFLQPEPVTEVEWGTARIVTVDCDNIMFEIDAEEIQTSVALTRLTGYCERHAPSLGETNPGIPTEPETR